MPSSVIAALQIGSHPDGKAATLEMILGFEQEIARSGARLVVMPEAILGGYPKGRTSAPGSASGCRREGSALRAITRMPWTSAEWKSLSYAR